MQTPIARPRSAGTSARGKPGNPCACKFATLLGALLFACAMPAAHAADSDGNFAVKGPGSTTCERFLQALEEGGEEAYAYGGWMEGYFTASNQFLPDTYDLGSWETSQTLAALLANHCRQNPEISFLVAVRQMVGALQNDRIKTRSDLVQAVHEGQGVRLYAETMERVQRRLADLGLYEGAADGVYGEQMRTALEAFQARENLAETGLPDQPTLMRLLRGS